MGPWGLLGNLTLLQPFPAPSSPATAGCNSLRHSGINYGGMPKYPCPTGVATRFWTPPALSYSQETGTVPIVERLHVRRIVCSIIRAGCQVSGSRALLTLTRSHRRIKNTFVTVTPLGKWPVCNRGAPNIGFVVVVNLYSDLWTDHLVVALETWKLLVSHGTCFGLQM